MIDIKQKLLDIGLVEDSEWLNKYVDTVTKRNTNPIKYKTQSHHIIPRFYYAYNKLETDNSLDNLVDLLVSDHLLAHYYLYKCCKGIYRYKSLSCISFFFGNLEFLSESEMNELTKEYQTIYEEFIKEQAKICGDRFRGVKQSESVIQNRVHKNTGKKRTDETRAKMSAWQKGKPKSDEARKNMSVAHKIYAANETKEHKQQRVLKYQETCRNRTPEEKYAISLKLSNSLKGRVQSDLERQHHSESLKGKAKSEKHKITLARNKSKYIYIINKHPFLSRKEAVEYIMELGEFVKYKVESSLQNCKYDLVDGNTIYSIKYLLKQGE